MDYIRPLILIGIIFLYTVGASVVQRDAEINTDGREGESGGIAHYLSAMIQLLKGECGIYCSSMTEMNRAHCVLASTRTYVHT